LNRASPQYELLGILDDNTELKGRRVGGLEVLGGLDLARTMPEDVQFVFGIGSHRTRTLRHEILKRIGLPDNRYETLVHPDAYVLLDAHIGPGCIVHPGVIIGQESVLEGFNLVFPHSIVASRNVLGKYSMLTSLVSLTNGVRLGRGVFIGTSSSVAEGVTIGAGAMIAMGSLVNKDVPPGVTAMGNPVRFFQKVDVPAELLDEHSE
jgi:sugar O-acyltransferase (sialic acid O-acetyltransferase NeuD family)